MVSDGQIRFDAGNGDGRLLGVSTDITDLVHERKERKRQRDELRQIMDLAPIAIYMKDCEGRYTEVNRAFLKKAGKDSLAEVLGKTAEEIFLPEEASKITECDRRVMMGHKLLNDEMRIVYPDGTERWYESSKVPRKHGSDIVGIVGISRDVTEKRQDAERQLKLSRLDAIDTLIVSLKHDFLYTFLGDIESALSKVDSFDSFRLAREEWKEMLVFLQIYIEHLQWWLPQGNSHGTPMTASKASFRVRPVVDQAIRWVDKYLSKPSCKNDVPDDLAMSADKMLCLLFLFNLLNNAKRFTPDDRIDQVIRVYAEIAEPTGLRRGVSLHVEDGGVGLPPAAFRGKMLEKGESYNPPGVNVKEWLGFSLQLDSACPRRCIAGRAGQFARWCDFFRGIFPLEKAMAKILLVDDREASGRTPGKPLRMLVTM